MLEELLAKDDLLEYAYELYRESHSYDADKVCQALNQVLWSLNANNADEKNNEKPELSQEPKQKVKHKCEQHFEYREPKVRCRHTENDAQKCRHSANVTTDDISCLLRTQLTNKIIKEVEKKEAAAMETNGPEILPALIEASVVSDILDSFMPYVQIYSAEQLKILINTENLIDTMVRLSVKNCKKSSDFDSFFKQLPGLLEFN